MNEVFKSMIEEHFFQSLFDSLQREIMDNYNDYDLALRADVVIRRNLRVICNCSLKL